ncbi:hypothetical protein AAEO56_05410 [Flavobacterium sp. DGU11]|uniref:Uncharacterized protein n=1 Tax=Flavobacterium arundinis TaxID=3139143 RepID=A0ABU9HU50_9FLAO
MHDKLREFKAGLLVLQTENKDELNGVRLSRECSPYISIQSAGVDYRKEIPAKIRHKVEALLLKIFK